jgi:hypothetical protein
MITELVEYFYLIAKIYCVYLVSILQHELLGHKRVGRRYGLTVLKTRKDVIDSGQKDELLKWSFFIRGFEFAGHGGQVHFKDEEFNRLDKKEKTEIYFAGPKFDIIFIGLTAIIFFFSKEMVFFWPCIIKYAVLLESYFRKGDLKEIQKLRNE